MKLLLDENLSTAQAEILRARGLNAVGVVEEGLGGRTDEEIRRHAIETGRILLTLDADFANILRFPPAGTPGVIRLKLHPPTETAITEALERGLSQLHSMELAGKLVVIDRNKIRVR